MLRVMGGVHGNVLSLSRSVLPLALAVAVFVCEFVWVGDAAQLSARDCAALSLVLVGREALMRRVSTAVIAAVCRCNVDLVEVFCASGSKKVTVARAVVLRPPSLSHRAARLPPPGSGVANDP